VRHIDGKCTFHQFGPWAISNHYYLEASDECFFLREYTPRGGYQASESNQLVLNLKKDLKYRGTPAWKYKGLAIERCASELKAALS
jgi:hypothetical protein